MRRTRRLALTVSWRLGCSLAARLRQLDRWSVGIATSDDLGELNVDLDIERGDELLPLDERSRKQAVEDGAVPQVDDISRNR
jgi:hypothetical protein